VQWGVRGVSKIQHKRPDFQHERVVNDPITGEEIKVYSPVKRLARQLLQVPFAIAAASVLGSLIAGCFAIEIFISEVYDGPFKAYLVSQANEALKHLLIYVDFPPNRNSHYGDANAIRTSHWICAQINRSGELRNARL
jgi:hypothetical protein